MKLEKHQKWCDYCRKKLRRNQGIRIGISVAHGVVKVCGQICLLKWNSNTTFTQVTKC